MTWAQHDARTAALGSLSPPQHLCAIYESAAARAATAAHGIDVETALERHALLLTNPDRAYMVRGRFEPEAMWTFWRQAAREAREQGFSGVRCIAETDWVARGAPGIERWMEYESRLSEMIADCGCSILCQYDRRQFPAWMVRNVIRTHPLVVARGVACRNMYYEPPAEFLGSDLREREVERLLEQIAQRGAVEEKLRRANATNAEILE